MIKVTTNAGRVAAEFVAKAGPGLQAEFDRITRSSGHDLRRAVQSHAPRQTGRYRRSWRTEVATIGAGFVVATTGTDEPYGYRLEEGHVGADSTGRVIDHPPQPHVEPALAEVGPAFAARIDAATRVWLAMQSGR